MLLRASLTVDLLAAGCYQKNPHDKCLFTLFSPDEISESQLLLDVDDFMKVWERIRSVVHVVTHWDVHVTRQKSELAFRAPPRQAGTVPRHKVSAVRFVTKRTFFCSYATR